jgi:hypothetical protein
MGGFPPAGALECQQPKAEIRRLEVPLVPSPSGNLCIRSRLIAASSNIGELKNVIGSRDLNARTQERWCDLRIYGELNYWRNPAAMRVSMAAIVALLILNFVDEHFYGGRYTQAAVTIASQIARSFG